MHCVRGGRRCDALHNGNCSGAMKIASSVVGNKIERQDRIEIIS